MALEEEDKVVKKKLKTLQKKWISTVSKAGEAGPTEDFSELGKISKQTPAVQGPAASAQAVAEGPTGTTVNGMDAEELRAILEQIVKAEMDRVIREIRQELKDQMEGTKKELSQEIKLELDVIKQDIELLGPSKGRKGLFGRF